MTGATSRRLAHGLWVTTAVLWLSTVVLTLIDRPSEAVPTVLVVIPLAIYGTLGALIARSRPHDPIGWLLSAVGLAFALWVFGLAYAQGGQGGDPELGGLPGAAVGAWVGVICGTVLLPVAFPTFLLLFPDGHLRSRKWRAALWAVVLAGILLLVGAIGQVDEVGTRLLSAPAWAAELPGGQWIYVAGLVLMLATSFAGIVALTLRYRSASLEARQPLRLLVVMIVAMAIATLIAVVTVLATQGANWSWFTIVLAFLVDGFGVLIGIPLATAAAVLTYGLYDVGVVVKKTVVYVLLVGFFVLMLALIGLLLSPLAFVGTDEGAGRETMIARVISAVAVFAIVALLLFRPLKRLARRLVYGKRSTRYEAMAEFSERLGDAYSTEDVLPRMAGIVRASTGADVARVWLRLGNELRPVAAAPSDASVVEAVVDARDELPAMDGVRAFPVRDRGELLGALTVAMPAAEPLSKDGEHLVTDLASQAGLMLRNVRLIEELQESRRRIVTAQDERARKLERDLHDGAQQQLIALSVKLGLAEQLSSRDPEKARTILAELKADATDALDNLRDLARGLYPPLLADRGLVVALEAQARKSPVPVRIESDGSERYPQEVEAAVYFCALEALQNMAKYSNATSATITLARPDGILAFAVVDDGAGFDPSQANGSGLTNMRDRLEAVGGTLEVSSSPGGGTTVAGRIPAVESR
jgi:signal transduction histidine kinase